MRQTIGYLVLISHIFFDLSNALRHSIANAAKAHSSSQQILFKEGAAEGSYSCTLSPIALPTKNATKSFWLASPEDNPLAEEGSTGELTEHADVCIIGSGITGVSAAWHLSQMMRGYDFKTDVVVLEAREFCSGATGRNGGHLSPNTFLSFADRQAKYNTSEAIKSYTIERYTSDSMVKFLKDRQLENSVDLVEGGHLTLLRTEDEERAAKADFEAASAAGLNLTTVRWISNQILVEEYGLSSNFNYTGVWWPGHNLWPCKLVTELFKDAQAGGNFSVTLHTKTPVTSITRRLESIPARWALQTPRGSIMCNYVLHATNAYAGHLLPFFAGSTEVRDSFMSFNLNGGGVGGSNRESLHRARDFSIIPTRGQVAAVRTSVTGSHFPWRHAWHDGGGWEYWFPRFQGLRDVENDKPRVILGGGREFSGGNLETGESDDGVVNAKVTKFLKAYLPRYFPALFKENEMDSNWEMEWTGIMGFTKTRDPYVGPVTHPSWSTQHNPYDGQYISAGYAGHGMVRAYACAEAVAGMIKSQIIGEKWVLPEWFPERYLTSAMW